MLASRRAVRTAAVVAFSLALMGVPAGPAYAAEGDPYLAECFSSGVVAPCTQITPTFTGIDVEVSPDGKHVYLFGRGPSFIRLFDRGANNTLTPRAGAEGCYNSAGTDGCTAVAGFQAGDVYDFELSPDGMSVYVANGNTIAHLRRNPSTGVLTPQTCYGSQATCTSIAPINTAYTVEVSKDGNNVYVRGGGVFGAFQRSPSDGTLIPEPDGEDCFAETAVAGCTDTYGLNGNAFEMDFSPDGKFLYYPIQSPGGVGFFQRSSNGTLTQISGPQGGCITTNGNSSVAGECATTGDGSGPAMGNGWAVTLSPSGKHVFVSSQNGTIVFSRDADVGKMTKTDCIAPNLNIAPTAITDCDQRIGSAGMGVAVSPNGTRAIVGANDNGGGVGVYNFNETTGELTQLPSPFGCFMRSPPPAGCGSFPGSFAYGKIAWAPDGLNFYATAAGPLGNFLLDYAPVCQPATVAVPFETSVAAPLSCTDVNGQAITFEIVGHPTNGVLAAINQRAATVAYDPFSGFSGTDSFTYRGTAFGAGSPTATVTLNVAPKPADPAPTDPGPTDPGPTDGDGDGYLQSVDCNDSNAAVHPGATDVPRNGIDEDCSGADSTVASAGPADSKFEVTGDGTAGTVKVNKKGAFNLKGHKVDCSGPGPDCAVTTNATAKVDFAASSAKRKRTIGGSRFTVASGGTKNIKVKLTKKAFKLLKRIKTIRATVVVKVTRGAQSSRKTVKVKLKPPAS